MVDKAQTLLLTLPAEARRYLGEHAEGPGLAYYPEHFAAVGVGWEMCESPEHVRLGMSAWLPFSEAEVLEVACVVADARTIEPYHEEGRWLVSLEGDDGGGFNAWVIETPWQSSLMLAALKCLTEAWSRK